TVEIPIIWDIVRLSRERHERILEVGNVLSHRFATYHDVLDKYERIPGIINEDVISYKPENPYDLIVSISTMEHVGWDESPKEPSKILKGLENLINMLSDKGKIIMTVPLGYNSFLDNLLKREPSI